MGGAQVEFHFLQCPSYLCLSVCVTQCRVEWARSRRTTAHSHSRAANQEGCGKQRDLQVISCIFISFWLFLCKDSSLAPCSDTQAHMRLRLPSPLLTFGKSLKRGQWIPGVRMVLPDKDTVWKTL